VSCGTPYSGSKTPVNCYQLLCENAGGWGNAKQADFRWEELLALVPWLAVDAAGGLLRQGDNSVPSFSATDTDISRHRLRLKGSALDIGPWSICAPTDQPPPGGMLDWDTYYLTAPAVRIDAQGDALLQAPVQASQTVRVTVWVRHDNLIPPDAGPQIVLRGDSISEQTATSTASDGTWQQLSVAATPSIDEVLTVVLRARNSAGTCRFSDLGVSA
jgi:hypothetical protein